MIVLFMPTQEGQHRQAMDAIFTFSAECCARWFNFWATSSFVCSGRMDLEQKFLLSFLLYRIVLCLLWLHDTIVKYLGNDDDDMYEYLLTERFWDDVCYD